ncbi:MAG TPA: hypothetical protein VLJ84_07505 [Usitatibacter sp.]|nr:hypothetical protein [Usitatibacter sp.]
MPRFVAAFIAMAIVIAAVLVARSETGTDKAPGRMADAVSKELAHAPKGSLRPEAVLAIAPRRSALPPKETQSISRLSPLLREFQKVKELKPLYERLPRLQHPNGEEQWMLATILQRCARIAEDEPDRFKRGKIGDAGARERFLASLPAKDSQRDLRIAAFDQMNYDSCGDLTQLEVKRKDIQDLFAAGAAQGDPKARVAMVQQSISDQQRGPDGKWHYDQTKPPVIDDSQVQVLRDAVSSADPYALERAISLLGRNQYGNFSLRTADDTPLDPSALWMASDLVACDYGAVCGADSKWLLYACAMRGQCAAGNIRDYMMYYASSPNTSQLMAQYETAIRSAATTGDWSFFRFHPGPAPGTAIYQAPSPP